MKNLINPTILFLFFLFSCNSKHVTENPISWDFQKDAHALLADGFYKAIIMNGMKIPEEIKILSQKMKDSLKGKEKWFITYLNENQDTLPYHPQFGISKIEFEKIQSYKQKAELRGTGTESLMIRSNKNEIRFEGSGYLSVLSDSRIDVSKKMFYFKGEKIQFSDTLSVRDTLNPIRSDYSSYEFKSEGKKDSISFTYLISISWLHKKQLPYFVISVKESTPTRILENYTLPFILAPVK